MKKFIAFTVGPKKDAWFVCTLPGEPDAFGPAPNGGYGYDKESKAKLLTERQAKRFIKDQEYVGARAGSYGVRTI